MYFQKDYVLRMIEMLGELVRQLVTKVNTADAIEEIEQIAQKACGLPLSMLTTGDIESLTQLLDEPQRFLAAELLMTQAQIESRTKSDEELMPLRIQALHLYSSLHEPDYMLPASDRVAQIAGDFLSLLPEPALLAAATFFERVGRYASAEDVLFAALEIDAALHATVSAFYDRISETDEPLLRLGGLSIEEIAEGRAALNERLNR